MEFALTTTGIAIGAMERAQIEEVRAACEALAQFVKDDELTVPASRAAVALGDLLARFPAPSAFSQEPPNVPAPTGAAVGFTKDELRQLAAGQKKLTGD